ncbi:hypothetical protein GCM10025876_34600 [Demequina litorisediminis]|uniref:Uncharacterized protein n=1 Tax=Demequina litorisediminis TaxID=1849022 RepID=A0ABQ6IHQ6_9MICO|nr:hypothetical protein GCM10025876_34600 [Demequina litorisediminis]
MPAIAISAAAAETRSARSPISATTAGDESLTFSGFTLILALRSSLVGVPTLLGEDKGCHVTGGTGARGAARAVQVRLVLGGRVHVDHELDAVDVDAAGGDVGRDQDLHAALGEGGEVTITGVLRQVAVQVHGGDAVGGGDVPGAWRGAWCA